jgi:hypothetical protein
MSSPSGALGFRRRGYSMGVFNWSAGEEKDYLTRRVDNCLQFVTAE